MIRECQRHGLGSMSERPLSHVNAHAQGTLDAVLCGTGGIADVGRYISEVHR